MHLLKVLMPIMFWQTRGMTAMNLLRWLKKQGLSPSYPHGKIARYNENMIRSYIKNGIWLSVYSRSSNSFVVLRHVMKN